MPTTRDARRSSAVLQLLVTPTGNILTKLPLAPSFSTAYKGVTKAKRGMRARARVGTGRLPAVTPRPTALLKQHGAELGHHACTAHSLAVHPRARHPSCPAGARGDDALVGLCTYLSSCSDHSHDEIDRSVHSVTEELHVGAQNHTVCASGRRWPDSHAPSCLVRLSGAPVTNPMKGVSGTMGRLG